MLFQVWDQSYTFTFLNIQYLSRGISSITIVSEYENIRGQSIRPLLLKKWFTRKGYSRGFSSQPSVSYFYFVEGYHEKVDSCSRRWF